MQDSKRPKFLEDGCSVQNSKKEGKLWIQLKQSSLAYLFVHQILIV